MNAKASQLAFVTVVGLLASTSAALGTGQTRRATNWGPAVTTWRFPVAGPNRLELEDRQVGISQTTGAYLNDTKVVTYKDVYGNQEVTHSSPWQVVDTRSIGIPATAKVVRISLKGIVTKGQSDGLATVYIMVRPLGSKCCGGPPGFVDYPVDHQLWQGWQVESVLQTVAQHAVEGVREWANVDVPLRKGRFEFAWGYRRTEGDWPTGDGVAFEMFANAYGS
jgi:hypothetical protein